MFITNGGCVENSALGSQDSPAPFRPELKPGGGWDMWRRIAARDPAFGRPDKFCSQPELSNWMSATITTLDAELARKLEPRADLTLVMHRQNGQTDRVATTCRLDTAEEVSVYEAGGVLQRFAQDFLASNRA